LGAADPSAPLAGDQLHHPESSEQPSQQLASGPDACPKVLLSVAFEEDQWLDTEEWLEWLLAIPALTKHAHLEAVFKSDSALLLMTLPVAVWDMLPEELACSFLGFVHSRNMMLDEQATSRVKAQAENFNAHDLLSKVEPFEEDSMSPKVKLEGYDIKMNDSLSLDKISPENTPLTQADRKASHVMENFSGTSKLPFPVTRNSRSRLTAQDWESQRTTFERLYLTEHRGLQEVMEIMKRDYGFVATYVFLQFSASPNHQSNALTLEDMGKLTSS
jgi:hypothetical protein